MIATSYNWVKDNPLVQEANGWVLPSNGFWQGFTVLSIVDDFCKGIEKVLTKSGLLAEVVQAPAISAAAQRTVPELNLEQCFLHFGSVMRKLTGTGNGSPSVESGESVASAASKLEVWTGPDGLVPFWRNNAIMKGMMLKLVKSSPPDMAAMMMDVRNPRNYDEMWEASIGHGQA